MASDIAAKRQEQLDHLPADVGGKIRGLSDYDFMDQDARQRFEELLDRLRKQVLDAQFSGLSDALKGMTQDDLAANRDMIRELNSLLQERLAGNEPTFPTSCRATAASSRAHTRSTTSSSSSPRAWPRCSH